MAPIVLHTLLAIKLYNTYKYSGAQRSYLVSSNAITCLYESNKNNKYKKYTLITNSFKH